MASESGGSRWHFMVEPRYMRTEYSVPVPGSEATVFTPSLVTGESVMKLQPETFEKLGINLESIQRLARQSASEKLAGLEPDYVRDASGVVVFAVLESDSPTVASTVLAPDFIAKFEDVLGGDLLVAIPNRNRVYVYPELASRFEESVDLVLRDYELSAYPGSREIFRMTPGGPVAIGVFEDQWLDWR